MAQNHRFQIIMITAYALCIPANQSLHLLAYLCFSLTVQLADHTNHPLEAEYAIYQQ